MHQKQIFCKGECGLSVPVLLSVYQIDRTGHGEELEVYTIYYCIILYIFDLEMICISHFSGLYLVPENTLLLFIIYLGGIVPFPVPPTKGKSTRTKVVTTSRKTQTVLIT